MEKLQELAASLPFAERPPADVLVGWAIATALAVPGFSLDRVARIADGMGEACNDAGRSAGHALVALAQVCNGLGIDLQQEGLAALTREFAHG